MSIAYPDPGAAYRDATATYRHVGTEELTGLADALGYAVLVVRHA